MKFNCASRDYKIVWHDWFAWFPVSVAENDCRWLETVDRRANLEYNYLGEGYWKYEYRAKGV
jgi:hypothetical protein